MQCVCVHYGLHTLTSWKCFPDVILSDVMFLFELPSALEGISSQIYFCSCPSKLNHCGRVWTTDCGTEECVSLGNPAGLALSKSLKSEINMARKNHRILYIVSLNRVTWFIIIDVESVESRTCSTWSESLVNKTPLIKLTLSTETRCWEVYN